MWKGPLPAKGLELGWLADEEPPAGCDEGWLVGVLDAGVLVSVFGWLDSWKFTVKSYENFS